MDALSRETALSKLCLLPSGKGVYYPFKIDPFSEGHWLQESKREVKKIVYLVKNGGKSVKCNHTPFSVHMKTKARIRLHANHSSLTGAIVDMIG